MSHIDAARPVLGRQMVLQAGLESILIVIDYIRAVFCVIESVI